MSDKGYVISPPPQASLPVRDSVERFPVRRIYCVGRNYAAHAVEMGHDPNAEPPFFFIKAPDTLVSDGKDFPYPQATSDVHHEIELVAALHQGGRDIPIDKAMGCVWGYGVALDMTRRDLQGVAKKLGRPWEVGKSFDHAAPCSELVRAADVADPHNGAITLHVNGDLRQEGDLNQMIWKLPEIIATLSGLFELHPGDLIMTGTPSGVSAVAKGDLLEGRVAGVGTLTVRVI